MPPASGPRSGTVEAILARIQELPSDGEPNRLELWIPEVLTLRGQAVANDVGMAVLLDALLAKSFFPDGVQAGDGGRLFRYVRE
jgi:hypothetical protein